MLTQSQRWFTFKPNFKSFPPSVSTAKPILITGASAGLGLAPTKRLLIHGTRETAGVRSVSKEEAKSKVLSDPDVKMAILNGIIIVLHLDLEDYRTILRFAGEVKQRYDGKLNMTPLNAGTGGLK